MDDRGYPRPQLERDEWISLNGEWRFRFDHDRRFAEPANIDDWPLTIQVPFAPESQLSGIGDTGFHRNCWYEREFDIELREGQCILHFGAVDYHCRVWVNGAMVIEHEGGHVPFQVNVRGALNKSGPQTLTVWVEDDPTNLEKPRGKQDWQLEPHSIWYPRTTGIWQTVWLEWVPETYIEHLRWSPHLERWEISFEAFIKGPLRDDMHLSLKLINRDDVLLDDNYRIIHGEVHRRIALSDPGIDDYRNELLWSPERPTLIQAEIKLMCGKDLIDSVRSYTALRAVNVDRDRFLLNGRPYQLRMVLDQGYWTESLMTAPSDDHLRRDVELAKAMGFNGVRKHQKIEDPRYLYWADVLGLLVWEEMPSAYRFTSGAINRMLREWSAAIHRDYSHPCIITWVPFNESWGVPNLTEAATHREAVAALYHLTKTYDDMRPVIGNDGWESSATDIIGIHDYDTNPQTLMLRYGATVNVQELFDRRRPGGRVLTLDGYPHRGQPIMLTEFGGVAFVQQGSEERGNAWGYDLQEDYEQFEKQVCSLLEVVRTTAMFSGFCYTQFSDTFQEANGLLNADRTPKIPMERLHKAITGWG